jgi:toxin ParE1/3/4
MRLILHPKVYSDIDKIMGYYERSDIPELADDFYEELRHFMAEAAETPESFSIRERDLRRVNLRRFPYHFLFRIVGEMVRVLVVRHHSRHPSFGIKRRCELGSRWQLSHPPSTG